MSLNSSLEEDGIADDEYGSEPSPSTEDFYEMFAACQRPCVVVLNRLSEEEIQRWKNVADDRPKRTHKQIAKHYLKDVPRVDFGLFDQYKRSRQKFINKRNRHHVSAEYGDFGFSSNEEVLMPSDDDDYVPEVSHRKKKRRLAYEDDDDWNPKMLDEGYSPRPKKTLRNLRVNTRRKRIESNSSSEDDFEDHDFENIYNEGEVFEDSKSKSTGDDNKQDYDEDSSAETKSASSKSKDVGFQSSTILDTDVVSQIMREMEDFNKQAGPKSVNSLQEDGKKSLESASADLPRPRQKRRISRVMKITDNLTPTIRQVQQVVKNMVNSVCSYEKEKKLALEESRKRACKWCDSPFQPRRQDEELCKICNDVVKRSTTPKTYKKGPKVKAGCSKPGINKIKSRALKILPKYEQRRLMYVDPNPTKNVATRQEVPENNITIAVAEVHPTPPSSISDVTNLMKGKKLKVSHPSSVPKTRVIRTKKKKNTDIGELTSLKFLPDQNTSSMTSAVGDNNQKGLLRIDFLGAETSSAAGTPPLKTIAPKQPVTNNVQYGTYLLPPIPTVVVANYAATDAKSGDYYLSSVYYQNEMTQSKNATSKNENPTSKIAATKTNSLPSMPSMDQLSLSFLDQLSNNSALSFAPLGDSSIFPSISTGCGIEAKVVNSKSLSNQVNNKNDYNHYNLESDLNLFLNNPNFQIEPVEPSVATTDIASLFSNTQLHIPLVSHEDMSYNLMEEDAQDEENNTELFTAGEELKLQSEDIPLNNHDIQASSEEPTNKEGTETSKLLNKSKETKPSLETKKHEETSEEEMTSEDLFRKMSIEIDAIGILGVVDLEKNPRFALENFMKKNRLLLEQLQGHTPLTKELNSQIKKIEENWLTLQHAKTLLSTFGSFEKLTKSVLLRSQILQIKKEKNLEHEEEQSACQFSQSQPIPEFIDIMDQQGFSMDNIPNIETEINLIPPADLSQFGTVHHFPVPASIPRSESRDTPSRGSGPVTPARPESAMSQVEEPALTPIQIKKERMEAESSSSPSQYSFTTPPVVRTPVAANQLSYVTSQQQQPQQQMINVQQQQMNTNVQQQQMINMQQQAMINLQPQQQMLQPQQQMMQPQQQMMQPPPQQQHQQVMGNVQHQQQVMNTQATQDTFTFLNEMTRRLQTQTTQVNNNSQLRNVLIAPNNAQMNNHTPPGSNQQIPPKITQYQNRLPPPPNVTVPNNQNISKVLLNLTTRLPQRNNPNVGNYIIKNGQMFNIQQQNNTQNTNVYKTTPMVNVQQVYLPSGGQQRYQTATNQPVNQYNISVQPGPTQGQLMVNSAGQSGYAFQGQQQMQASQQLPSVSPLVQQQNPVVQQQNQVMQSMPNPAFLMPNNRQLDVSSGDTMFCALCGKTATLRCKQCAKIAYCDTKCARSYWHNVHKRECVPMAN